MRGDKYCSVGRKKKRKKEGGRRRKKRKKRASEVAQQVETSLLNLMVSVPSLEPA